MREQRMGAKVSQTVIPRVAGCVKMERLAGIRRDGQRVRRTCNTWLRSVKRKCHAKVETQQCNGGRVALCRQAVRTATDWFAVRVRMHDRCECPEVSLAEPHKQVGSHSHFLG